jgi:hypothetical protein
MEMAQRSDINKQRKQAMKTAWLLAAIAAVIFITFVLSGVLGS